jgi:hypothetical protein
VSLVAPLLLAPFPPLPHSVTGGGREYSSDQDRVKPSARSIAGLSVFLEVPAVLEDVGSAKTITNPSVMLMR